MPGAVRALVDDAFAKTSAEPASAEAATRLGMVLQAHGQNLAAEACYARAHALDFKRYDTLYYWSQAAAARGDHKKAVELLRKAVRLRPASMPARLALAQELREAGDNDGSASIARGLLLEKYPEPSAHYALGRATNNESELQKALDLFPRYGAAQFALASLYRKNGKADEAAALLKNYERDKTIAPPVDDPEMRTLRGLAISPASLLRRAVEEEAAGRLQEAAALQREALAIQPDLADAWVNLISLNARLHRDSDAEAAYAKAVALAPNRAEAHYNFGVYCLQRNRFSEAKIAFQKTLDAAPRNAEACLNLGGILANEGRLEEAAAMLRRAIDAKPDFAQARVELKRIEDFLGSRRK